MIMLFLIRVIIQYDAFRDASGTLKNISVSAFKGANRIEYKYIETYYTLLFKHFGFISPRSILYDYDYDM